MWAQPKVLANNFEKGCLNLRFHRPFQYAETTGKFHALNVGTEFKDIN